MKTTVLAMLSLLLLGAPTLAVESRADCATGAAAAGLAAALAAKLPVEGRPFPATST